MQRRNIIITLLLILSGGAIVNVAVAWGCASILHEQRGAWTSRVGVSAIDNGFIAQALRLDRAGHVKINAFIWHGSIETWDQQWESASDVLETWCPDLVSDDLHDQRIEWVASASGWPRLTLRSIHYPHDPLHNFALPAGNPRVLPRDKVVDGILVKWRWLSNQLILPTGVIWSGFVFNSLFYALLLWLLFLAPFTARRMIRRRRGLCEKCAYPVGTWGSSPVCTECGAAVSRPRKAAA